MNYIDQYKKNGFFILRKFYSKSLSRKILNKINSIDIDKYENSKEKNGHPFRITNISKKNKDLVDLYLTKKLKNVLQDCLGDKIVYFKDKYVSKQKGGRIFVPHIDGAFKVYNYRLKKQMNGWFTYASKFIHVQILLSPNTRKNGCLHICNKENDDPKYYQKKYFNDKRSKTTSEFPKKFHKKFYKSAVAVTGKIGDVLIFNPLCPHFSHTNNTKSKRNTFLITFNGRKDGNKYYLSDYDKKLSLKTRKRFIDDQ